MAAGDCIDYEGIRETLIGLGDDLYALGFDWFLEGIEGNNRVGRAMKDPRTKDEIILLEKFMIGAARKLKQMNMAHPGNPHVTQAMIRLDEAWQDFKACLKIVNRRPPETAMVHRGAHR